MGTGDWLCSPPPALVPCRGEGGMEGLAVLHGRFPWAATKLACSRAAESDLIMISIIHALPQPLRVARYHMFI